MDQKPPFIAAYRRDRLAMTELCALDGVSRTTGYTWVDRDLTHGPHGLEERSRRPSTSPRHTPDQGVAARLDARRRPPSWGAEKRLSSRSHRHPRWPGPARSTVWDRLNRHGLGPQQRRRRVIGPPGQPTRRMRAPHEGWSAACTGHVKTRAGRSGSPLTITEGHSRVLRRCQALASTRVAEATPVFTRVCKECGVPQRIRTDNGVPCATHTRGRLSQRSARWIRLGLLPACIAPGTPHQHGRHERRPRTLNADTTRPPGANLRAQPQKVNHFRDECHHERPHEALDLRPPTACDEPSPRTRPHQRPPLESPDRFEVRYVSANGGLRWHHPWGNVSHVCVGA